MSERVLSQQEIDNVFRNLRETKCDDLAAKAQRYDFRRPDRIAKDQLRAIHALHENFARNLASSLSAYLRAYVTVNLVSVEQLSFQEFTRGLPSPTSLSSLGLKPFDGNAVLEINPQLVFPILEMLLGGGGKLPAKITREVTEIEQSILDGLLRIILNDLRTAWSPVADIEFSIAAHETEPPLLQLLAPNEAVVAIGLEVKIYETSGMMNIGVPSIVVKMLRQRFDQQWSLRKSEATEQDRERILRLLRPALMNLDTRLDGMTLGVNALLDLQEGDVLSLDYPVDRPLNVTVNGQLKFRGEIVTQGRKRALEVTSAVTKP